MISWIKMLRSLVMHCVSIKSRFISGFSLGILVVQIVLGQVGIVDAQNAVPVPASQDIRGYQIYGTGVVKIFDGSIRPVAQTSASVWIGTPLLDDFGRIIRWDYKRMYQATQYEDVVAIHIKPDSSRILVLLDNGKVKMIDCKTGDVSDYGSGITFLISAAWKDIGGDAVYALAYTLFTVTRDSGSSWQADTAGISNVNYNAFALDASQYVYLATTDGLFKQHPDSSVWHKINSFPESYANALYIDSRNRIFVGTYYSSYMSTDGGASWTSNSAGLLSGGISKYGQDSFGNIYAIGGGAVYRSDSGTASWTRIDTPITNKIMDPVSQFSNPYFAIGGDSLLNLTTAYGLFVSTDQGNSWTEDNDGIPAESFYGYLKTPNRQFASTDLGLFYLDNGDTVWSKSFPQNGYAVGNSVYTDNSGTLYTLGPIINPNNSQSPNSNWKSTDDGTTWIPDTSGLSAMGAGSIAKYFADEDGVQHYAASGIPAECYLKTSGSSWGPDTSGLAKYPPNYPNAFFSDGRGNLYLAVTTTTDYTGMLLKRPIGGGSWSADTAGLQKAIVYSLSVDANGNLYAGTYGNGVYKKVGDQWFSLSSPGGLSGNDAFVTAVTKSGALFAGFAYQNGFNFAWQGVYFTTNDGGNWTKIGLDGVQVRALISYGDSVYAVTANGGLQLLTAGTGTEVRTASTPGSFALLQNYPNPFNPSTVISYQLTVNSYVTLKVYDVLGRVVATLIQEQQNAGSHSITFRGENLPSGVYFYSINAGTFSSVRKMLLLK